MISKLSIRNFKSIKELDIDCARVNLFIGEPNTGKSNILEALGLLSWCGCEGVSLNDFVRFQYTSNLFYDNLTNQFVEVNINTESDLINIYLGVIPKSSNFPIYHSRFSKQEINKPFTTIELNYQKDLNNEKFTEALSSEFNKKGVSFLPNQVFILVKKPNQEWLVFNYDRIFSIQERNDLLNVCGYAQKFRMLDQFGKTNDYKGTYSSLEFIKFYKYKQLEGDKFPDKSLSTLVYPYGSNMLTLISTTKKHRETISSFFKDFGFKPSIREFEDSLEFEKETDDLNIHYPYVLVSDTLRRMIFYNIAIDSNKDSTLVFEEPEVHAFPAYTKRFGEKIAFDKSNQYFIVTHNPYLFLSILEKTPKEDVNVFITYSRDYQTKVKHATSREISKLMTYDPFFNLDMFIPKLRKTDK
jgi:hypothetical protein